jgi:predicted N-acyltransferase
MKSLYAELESKCFVSRSIQHLYQGSRKPDDCPPSKKNATQLTLSNGYTALVYRSAFDLPESWDHILADDQYFLSRQYLQAFEQYRPLEMDFAYLSIHHRGELLAVMNFQLLTFNTVEQVRSLHINEQDQGWTLIGKRLMRALLKNMNFNMIISGATQFTGENGWACKGILNKHDEQCQLLDKSIRALAKHLKGEGWRAQAALIKDYFQPLDLKNRGYHPFPFMPNMTMEIPAEWQSQEDYLNAMRSKYRVRARRAFKKASEIHVREFSLADIVIHEDELYSLYSEIEEGADFSMIRVPKDYFAGLKENMPEAFRLFAYYHQEEMVGFFTTLRNGPELEAHFLGLNNTANLEYQLYLNMLYHMVEVAIDEGVEKLVFARTASAIKSSVGAVPQDMHCYMRHFSPLMNAFFPYVVSYLEPEEDWTPRNPFG